MGGRKVRLGKDKSVGRGKESQTAAGKSDWRKREGKSDWEKKKESRTGENGKESKTRAGKSDWETGVGKSDRERLG